MTDPSMSASRNKLVLTLAVLYDSEFPVTLFPCLGIEKNALFL